MRAPGLEDWVSNSPGVFLSGPLNGQLWEHLGGVPLRLVGFEGAVQGAACSSVRERNRPFDFRVTWLRFQNDLALCGVRFQIDLALYVALISE